jgi:hypothetical protein
VGLANAIEYEEVKFWEIGDNGRRKQRKQVAQKNRGWLKLLLQVANPNMFHNKGWN